MNNTDSKGGYAHVLKYTGIFGGVQLLSILVGIVRNKVAALLIGPTGMGLVALFSAVQAFVVQATGLGVSFSAIRHLSELYDAGDEEGFLHHVRVVRGWGVVTALLALLVCMGVAPLMSGFAFDGGNHTLHFLTLAPACSLTILASCEAAILKAAHKLRALALAQVWTVVAALLVSAPAYYLFGVAAIVPVLVLTALASLVLTVAWSYRLYPLKLRGLLSLLGEGTAMVRLGVAFTLAGIVGSGCEMLVRALLNVSADLDTVGLYNAGYVLTVTYSSMVFSAMETDYFPRLSAVNHDAQAVRQAANRQAEVSLLIIAPMIAAMVVALPLIVPLLYSGKFAPVTPMAQVAVLAMYFKGMTLPVAYITLAKGDSGAFLALESAYYVVFVLLIVFGFSHWGLLGTGYALLAANMFDLVMIFLYAHLRYGYSPSWRLVRFASVHIPLGAAAYAATFIDGAAARIIIGVAVAVAAGAASLFLLRRATSPLPTSPRGGEEH